MRSFLAGLLFLAVVLYAAGCVPAQDMIPLASVNKHVITAGEFKLKAKLYGLNAVTKKETIEFLNLLINDYIVLEQAKKMNVAFTKEELRLEIEDFAPDYSSKETRKMLKESGISYGGWLKDIEEKVLRKKTILAVMKDKIKIQPEEVKDYYWSNIVDFRTQKRVRIRQIVTDSEEKAKEVQQHIMRNEPFDKLAMKYSVTSDSKIGGDLGYFSEGDMPAFISDVVFQMKKGSVSGIVKSPYGWHIFLCEDIQEADTPKYDVVKKEVFDRYYEEKKDDYFNSWMKDLRKEAKITVFSDNIGILVSTKEEIK
jgi:parvulin-like peptidyl-prolyl isomerase